jgi:hypothetical protein
LESPALARLSYPAADLDPAHAKLTVRRARPICTPTDLSFNFEAPDRIAITRPAGFDARAIYELIYLAKDPKVMGLGFAATRDIVSYLRHETADAAGNANALAGQIDLAIGFGLSQSGRYLHDFLYWGFNTDEAGRPVFEGLMPHIAGGKKTFTNYRFSQPGRSPYRHTDTVYPGSGFPFTYPVTTAAMQRGSRLARSRNTRQHPHRRLWSLSLIAPVRGQGRYRVVPGRPRLSRRLSRG